MTDSQQVPVEQLIAAVDKRLDLFHTTLDERLLMKDRWIASENDALEKALLTHVAALETRLQTEHTFSQAQRDAIREYVNGRIDAVLQRIKQETDSRVSQFNTHGDIHTLEKESLKEFKDTTQLKINDLQSGLDRLTLERGLFVLREAHETQLDAITKAQTTFEKAITERMQELETRTNERADNALEQIRVALDNRITANTEKLQKIEQVIQIANARNQQSIIALGILLTVLEIVIRFYQN